MTSELAKILSSSTPAVVGTIHSPAALREALRLSPEEVDLLELRVDHFVQDLRSIRRALPQLRCPLIVTVRHPDEGGAAKLDTARRRELYHEFLPAAAWIDVEMRSAKALADVLGEAGECGVGRIVSWHQFSKTPSHQTLDRQWQLARKFAPEIVKFATRTRSRKDLATLISFLADRPNRPATSVMGMREFGKVSRLVLAATGSALNYGYLGELQVPGQWPARLLKKRLSELSLT